MKRSSISCCFSRNAVQLDCSCCDGSRKVCSAIVARSRITLCSAGAPGSEPAFRATLWLFFARVLLCWVALGLLPWSAVKGGYHYEPVRGERASVARKGGRVWYWMCYDLVVAAGCLALVAVIYDRPGGADWVQNAQLFHVKVLYGMLSFPWMVLKLPMMYSLILALKPTNYNRAGETVRPATGREMAAARDARRGKVGPA